jgi:Sec-independent protein secretion pathway component TatC
MNSSGAGGGDGAEMSVLAHLDELRRRLIVSIIAIVVTVVVSFVFFRATPTHPHDAIEKLILFAFSEIITPVSDPIVAPAMVMCPLLILYEVSLLCASRIEHKRT